MADFNLSDNAPNKYTHDFCPIESKVSQKIALHFTEKLQTATADLQKKTIALVPTGRQ